MSSVIGRFMLPCSNPAVCLCLSVSLSAGRLASRLLSTPHHVQQVMTLSFLENQLSSAFILHSANEYRHWLLIYARFLVNEGEERRMEGGILGDSLRKTEMMENDGRGMIGGK